jgi:hypothetical protein
VCVVVVVVVVFVVVFAICYIFLDGFDDMSANEVSSP